MKRDVFDGLKIEGLMEALDVPRFAAAGILQGIWALTQRFHPQGNIGRATNRQIAERIGWPPRKADKLIEALIESRWLDPMPGPDRLYVHDWHEHCEDSIHMMLARKTLLFSNGSRPKLQKLEKSEREYILSRYENKGLTEDLCAQGAHKSALPLASCPLPLAPSRDLSAGAHDAHTPLGSASANSSADGVAAPDRKRKATTPKAAAKGNGVAAPRKPTEEAMRDWSQRALAAKAAGLPIPPKPGSEPDEGTPNNLGSGLAILDAGPVTDPEEAERRALNTLWLRIRDVTHDSKPYMAWWAAALPSIAENPGVHQALLDALDYASDCADEAVRASKGIGAPLDNPGGYVSSKVLAAARAAKMRLPESPKSRPTEVVTRG